MNRGRTFAIDRMHITPMDFDVPLNWAERSGQVRVHATEVVAAEKRNEPLPTLCYLNGGPGMDPGRPEARSGWLKHVLERYRVVLLDQRGTGQSTPLESDALPLPDGEELGRYLTNFRADSIVRDAEHIRRELLGDEKWTLMGQSFGGFTSLTYLSLCPEGVAAVINTGGFAPVMHNAEQVYQALVGRIIERNQRHYIAFPEDRVAARRIVDHLASGKEIDVHGNPVTPRQFLAAGEWFGHSPGSAEVHWLIERANSDLDQLGRLSNHARMRFADVMRAVKFPIYAVLHESIYSQGQASNWAAERVITSRPEFALDTDSPYFTGEMIFPWIFDDVASMRSLKATADWLADYDEWPALFDIERLRSNEAPVVGLVFWDDLYVDRNFAVETAGLVGNCNIWLTNEFEHLALWDDPDKAVSRLFQMLDEKVAP